MINIFYNKTTLKDTMLVSVSMKKPNITKNHKDVFTALYKDEELVGINIFNVSKHIKLNDGMILANKQILDFILKITKINLSKYEDKNFVVGEIVKLEPIPNTHLNYCDVDVKDKVLKVVCGAANAKQNLKVVVAMINTFMPDGKPIIKNSIQGKESFGMLCSAKELNMPHDNKKGIIELNNSYQVGELFVEPFSNK
ncbi:conserved hypothetical protein [Malacoplasma penetrans HF-2]|uniref:tRNA-binding domain-containing protein n=1 Tax=Malacoplasma penetrans (strain HF-2) TaxID=272633 RepID=Q8EUI5_MALP2|nr:hypothetical protein [Malacoplasma penetrans]BAC44728.1 conserved hypothetical protein [Malacoplasma penetrans HF-2]